jgi:hypothetical protein
VVVLAGSVAPALNDTCCGVPGVRVKVDGMTATPLGSPLKVTAIDPVKPLIAVAETVT